MTKESAMEVFGLDHKVASKKLGEMTEKDLRNSFENTCTIYGNIKKYYDIGQIFFENFGFLYFLNDYND